MAKKRLITSALPYVNNEPHLGNIIGCVLSADTYARFCRSKGYETLYICGTDEYGTATETKAAQEGLSPREICDKYNAIHKKIYDHFNISFDAFGRTSDDTHIGVVQEIYKQVDANGYLITKESEQFYSETQQKFLADRLIEGTCPKCGYEDARGDQCDGCGSMLTPTELVNPRSAADGSTPTLKKTTHQYIDIPALEDKLRDWQEEALVKGFWPNNATSTTRSWMNMDLEPRAITRDLKWGVPVPKEGFENKVFYVWFDAPIGYVSITKHKFPETWKDWWFSLKTQSFTNSWRRITFLSTPSSSLPLSSLLVKIGRCVTTSLPLSTSTTKIQNSPNPVTSVYSVQTLSNLASTLTFGVSTSFQLVLRNKMQPSVGKSSLIA